MKGNARNKKKLCKIFSMKLNLKFNKSFFLQNLEFLLEFFGKIQEMDFLCSIFMDFFTQVFLFTPNAQLTKFCTNCFSLGFGQSQNPSLQIWTKYEHHSCVI